MWIKLYGEISESWKMPALCDALKISEPQAMGHLMYLWMFTERNAWRDGDLAKWGIPAIARAAKWEGDAKTFVDALQKTGWLDGLQIHEWESHQSELIRVRSRYESGKHRTKTGQSSCKQSKAKQSKAKETATPKKLDSPSPLPEGKGQDRAPQTPPAAEEHKAVALKPSADSPEFNKFWEAYPRKVGKDAARRAWNSKKPPLDSCLAALQIHSVEWNRRGDMAFVPHPATWLNQGRWADAPEAHGEKLEIQQPRRLEQATDDMLLRKAWLELSGEEQDQYGRKSPEEQAAWRKKAIENQRKKQEQTTS